MIHDNFSDIKKRIAAAVVRADRPGAAIKLVAVSKKIPPQKIMQAIAAGHSLFGENYVQEALDKIPAIRTQAEHPVQFHFIGKLQRNKAKKAVELFDVIETVDSLSLGLALEKHCANLNKPLEAYVQVNIGAEKQKSGILPAECENLLRGLIPCKYLRLTGLMAITPYVADPEDVRPFFKNMRLLAEQLTASGLLGQLGPVELSMGMSGDFEVAIEEGATVVRIGTALFGPRPR